MTDISGVDPSASSPPTSSTSSSDGTVDAATLMQGFQGAISQYTASKNDLNTALGQAQGASEQEQYGTTRASEAQQEINSILGSAKAKEIADDRGAAAHFGTNPDAASYVIATLGDRILASEADVSSRRDMISEKLQTGFMDNPMQWIVNQFTLPMDVYAANLKIAGINQDLDVIHQLEQATREQAATNAVIDQGDATKLAAQQNIMVAAKAVQDVAKSQIEMAKLGMTAVGIKDAVTKDQNDALYQFNNALAEKQRLSLETERQSYYIAAKQEAEAKAREALDAKTLTDEQTKFFNARLQKAGALYGIAAPTFAQLKVMQGPMRGIFEQLAISEDTAQGRLASTPALSVNNANKINAPLTDGMNDTRSKLMKMMAVAHNDPNWARVKPEDQIFAEDGTISTVVKNEAKNIPEQGGIYSPLSLSKLITANPVVAQNPIGMALAPLAAADPAYVTKSDDVFKVANTLITTGKLTPASASDAITELYKTMQMSLNQVHQYQRFALPILSDQTGYRQNVWLGGGFVNGGSQIVDLTNKAAVENVLTRQAVSRKIGSFTGNPAVDEQMNAPAQGGAR